MISGRKYAGKRKEKRKSTVSNPEPTPLTQLLKPHTFTVRKKKKKSPDLYDKAFCLKALSSFSLVLSLSA